MNRYRKPTKAEQALLKRLLQLSNLTSELLSCLSVCNMSDGGMGSLLLLPKGVMEDERVFGKSMAEVQFVDADGVSVLATLYLDSKGNLFELDIWKTDFSPLVELPENF